MKSVTDLQNDIQSLNSVTNALAASVAGVSNTLTSLRQQLQDMRNGATPEQIDAMATDVDNSLTALQSATGALVSLAADPNNPVPPVPPLPTPAPGGVADTGQADGIVAAAGVPGGGAGTPPPAAPVDFGASTAPAGPAAGSAAAGTPPATAGGTAPPPAPPPAMDVV